MPIPTLNDCLNPFLHLLSDGAQHTRHTIRERFASHFEITDMDELVALHRRIGWCDTYLVGAGLVNKLTMPPNPLHDTFQLTALGTKHVVQRLDLTVGYVRDLCGSKVLRGSGSDFTDSWSEWAVCDLLEALPDDYAVFHSIRWRSKGGGTQGEVDFLVAHPQKGVLVIEVKGGVIFVQREGNRVKWYSQAESGRTYTITDPIAQVERNTREMRLWLKHHPITQHHTYALFPVLIFPDSQMTTALRPDVPEEIVLDMRHLDDVRARIDAIYAYYLSREHPKMGGEDAVSAIHELILPTRTLTPSIATLFARERRIIDQLTEQQLRVLSVLRWHWRTMVLGGAGTGKTLIAIEKAMQLAQENYRVLFLGYNAGLVDWVERVLVHPNITVANLHRIVGKAMYWAGLGAEMDARKRGQFDDELSHWLKQVTTRLHADPSLREKYLFDALVVDEGQDFDSDDWNSIVKFLKQPLEDTLYVFADDTQRIFGDLRDKLPPLGEPFYLGQNCRTTQHIHARASAYTKEETTCAGPEGRPVQIHPATTPQQVYQTVADVLHHLIVQGGISAEHVIILTPRSHKKETLWGLRTQLGDFTVVRRFADDDDPARTVRVSTIHAYKGLECEVAILTELDHAHPANRDALIYVALTRARHDVYVVGALPPPMG